MLLRIHQIITGLPQNLRNIMFASECVYLKESHYSSVFEIARLYSRDLKHVLEIACLHSCSIKSAHEIACLHSCSIKSAHEIACLHLCDLKSAHEIARLYLCDLIYVLEIACLQSCAWVLPGVCLQSYAFNCVLQDICLHRNVCSRTRSFWCLHFATFVFALVYLNTACSFWHYIFILPLEAVILPFRFSADHLWTVLFDISTYSGRDIFA